MSIKLNDYQKGLIHGFSIAWFGCDNTPKSYDRIRMVSTAVIVSSLIMATKQKG